MPSLANTDFVQLPADGAGKKTAFLKETIGGVDIYVPASVLVDSAGNLVDVSASTLVGTERGLVTRSIVSGQVASGATDAGNPVKVGGVFNTAEPTLTNGQRGDAQMNTKGELVISIGGALSTDGQSAGACFPRDQAASQRPLAVLPWHYNGTSLDKQRTPNKFFTAVATGSGDTAVWTPTTGKKFRLMSYVIYMTANASQAVAGLVEVILRDATSAIGVGYSVYVPGAAGTAFVDSSDSSPIVLGNGFLSAAANNVLNVNLSAALATGEVRVVAWGTEE